MAQYAGENFRMTIAGLQEFAPGPSLIPGLGLVTGAGRTVQQTWNIGPTPLRWGLDFVRTGKVAGALGALKNLSVSSAVVFAGTAAGIAAGSVLSPIQELVIPSSPLRGQCR
jgi:hypothetical protein